MPSLLSLTMPPQSASGGWMPSPRKESVDRNSTAKMKRRPNSATSGDSALGRISRKMIQPRLLAAQLGGLDEVHDVDVERHGARQAERRGWSRERR